MPRCIFCKSTSASFTTREHILPESLGGGDWGILPPNLFCDNCQNHFGSKVEREALGDYPFSLLRVFLGIPTKSGKAPWLDSWEGVFRGSPVPGQVGYDPSELFRDATMSRQKTVARLLAEPRRPNKVCRALLKMGIELVAADDPVAVFEPKYDVARQYALSGGASKKKWWYLQCEDMESANRYLTRCATLDEWQEAVDLSTFEVEQGAEMFCLRLFWVTLMTPLDDRIQPPDMSELAGFEYRLYTA